ncbi:hypothetical protein HB364_14055 [Pseudoflavitalea sp. X16]|uniref:hypothetical protein n=1 Tax=Paraflavitalea devenefica TaxID=2716334 RepID=UPI0014211320|nr:hypothetical protein [Paraflavitalea devenefica]NII26213.1 hypothetical protein [Paraflavitalea devenefica]
MDGFMTQAICGDKPGGCQDAVRIQLRGGMMGRGLHSDINHSGWGLISLVTGVGLCKSHCFGGQSFLLDPIKERKILLYRRFITKLLSDRYVQESPLWFRIEACDVPIQPGALNKPEKSY